SKYPNAQWLLETLSKKKTLVTIGSDIECFGHHRGQDSFKFLKYFIENAQDNDVKLVKGSEAIKKYKGLAKTYSTETVTTWARSINVFFPHSKIIEMWFARNDAVSMYHRVEYFYFKLENAIQKMMENEESKKLQKIYDQLLAIKLNEIDDIRWAIYRQLTDAALYHEDFSNEKTYHSMLEKCRWIKGRLWEVEDRLNGIMYQL
ncbi:MAG: hypothetical protein U9O98_00705, partial [Asgard group archaeon]|nr:hypothetical protein [Asgard group archaeon]